MGNKVGNKTSYTPQKKSNAIDIFGIFTTDSKTKSANKQSDRLYADDKLFEKFDSILLYY
jgi:hypothetical protein